MRVHYSTIVLMTTLLAAERTESIPTDLAEGIDPKSLVEKRDDTGGTKAFDVYDRNVPVLNSGINIFADNGGSKPVDEKHDYTGASEAFGAYNGDVPVLNSGIDIYAGNGGDNQNETSNNRLSLKKEEPVPALKGFTEVYDKEETETPYPRNLPEGNSGTETIQKEATYGNAKISPINVQVNFNKDVNAVSDSNLTEKTIGGLFLTKTMQEQGATLTININIYTNPAKELSTPNADQMLFPKDHDQTTCDWLKKLMKSQKHGALSDITRIGKLNQNDYEAMFRGSDYKTHKWLKNYYNRPPRD